MGVVHGELAAHPCVGRWLRMHRAGTRRDIHITILTQRLGLVFVAVYQKALHLSYVDGLLAKVNNAFSARYDPAKHRCGGAWLGGCVGYDASSALCS